MCASVIVALKKITITETRPKIGGNMEIENKKQKKIIRIGVTTVVVVLILIIIGLLILKYEVEGETNMPFQLSKVMVVSTAEGIQKTDATLKWDMNVVQNNDIYLEIAKNKNYRQTEIIDRIVLDNFQINKEPEKGSLTIYRPTTEENKTYSSSEDMVITQELIYTGSEESDLKNLKVANQGGMILLRYTNKDISNYQSNEDDEITHDGTLLKKTGINIEQVKTQISFDITIYLVSEKSYKATITLDLPVGDITEEGTSHMEKKDCTDIIFKRQ